jgi:hypothetical protein
MTCVPSPAHALAGRRLPTLLLAACLCLPATMLLHAEEAPQDWVPSVLVLPDDMELLSERAIGSSIRMFSFSTGRDPEELLAEWEAALRATGHEIVHAQDDGLDRTIEFSGEGIINAKIVVKPAPLEGRAVIEFDASLP